MDIRRRNLKVFGFGLAVIFCIVALRTGFKAGWGIAALLLAVTLVRVELLGPVYTGWMKVAHLIGTVFSTLLLVLLYSVAFAPAGVVLRLLGKDPLDRKIDRKRESYWCPRPDRPPDYSKPF